MKIGSQAQRRRRRRRNRLLSRALPLALLAIAAFVFGVYEAGASGRAQTSVIKHYAGDYARGDYAAMYALLSTASQQSISLAKFTANLKSANAIATVTSLSTKLKVHKNGSQATVPFIVGTSIFGDFSSDLTLSMVGSGSSTRFTYDNALLLPGLGANEKLTRKTQMGPRGNLLAADGEVLASGTSLSSTSLSSIASEIDGSLGPIPTSEKTQYESYGYPAGTKIGVSGLEALLERQLAGRPGGQLYAGGRLIASSKPVGGGNVRTTIVPKLEEAAMTALGSSVAGMTVMNPTTGAVEAIAGLAINDLQPPGSTFKIVTAAAALTSGTAAISTTYPYETSTYIGGYKLQNAAKESCGGTLLLAFATSCDTVFGPLGITIGADKLVSMAEKFGFNQNTYSPTVLTSTIPTAATIGNDTAIGSTAIGQGELEATTLQIADVGATIANGGLRAIPSFLYGAKPKYVRVVSAAVAADIQKMMIAVVTEGTGVTAAISGVQVAGKTGTAELANTANQTNDTSETDAWFVGYAPATTPRSARIVACALFPASGYGEDTAAPAVREVLETALGK